MSESTDKSLDPAVLLSQLVVARKEINNLRQQLVSLTHVHKKECELINKKIDNWKCPKCINKHEAVATPQSDHIRHDFQANYIGKIRTHFPQKRGTPRQPGICDKMIAKLTLDNSVFTNPAHSLAGLQEFSHIWILFHFHKNDSTHVKAKVAPPRLNGVRSGVFATRSPHRPCPIGLSLVKIDRIMDNTIYFSGVDMVNETPVLDIKPYIPQYDNPSGNNFNCSVIEVDESNSGTSRDLSLNLNEASTSNSIRVLENPSNRIMDGEENSRRENVLGAPTIESNMSRLEESFYSRASSRIGEREAPDGEEEESPRTAQPPTSLPIASTPDTQVRVPTWIDQPPVSRLAVLFKDRALTQLTQLGPEGDEKKTTITNILREDPRSVYLRERWGSHCYVFRIAELYVSCKFNDSNHSVTVYQVFQNEAPPENDD